MRSFVIALNFTVAIALTLIYLKQENETDFIGAMANYFCAFWNLINLLSNKNEE